jgi:hypothetical protein
MNESGRKRLLGQSNHSEDSWFGKQKENNQTCQTIITDDVCLLSYLILVYFIAPPSFDYRTDKIFLTA